MVLPKYKNLTRAELKFADHYAETGNNVALRQMQRLSKSREKTGEFRADLRRL